MSGQAPLAMTHEFLWLIPTTLTAPLTVTSTYVAGLVTLRAPVTGNQPIRAVGPGQVLFQTGPSAVSQLLVDGASEGRADVTPASAPASVVVETGGSAGFSTGTFGMPIQVGGPGTSQPSIASSWAPGALRVQSNGQDAQPVLTGTVTLTSAATFGTSQTVTTSALRLDGPVTGPVPLTLVGGGTITLGGATTVDSVSSTVRRLVIYGSVSGPVSVLDGSTVSGSGSVAGLNMTSGAGLALPVDGSSSTHLTSTGPVGVGGTLTVTTSSLPVVGARVLVVDNATAQPVSGTFAGLAEGAVFTAAGARWQITYQGGDGNDIELQRIAQADLSVSPVTAQVAVGESTSLDFTVANAGPDDATGDLTVAPPDGVQVVEPPTGCTIAASGTVTCPVVVPGGGSTTTTLELAASADAAPGTFSGTIAAIAAPGVVDATNNNTADLTITITPAPTPTPTPTPSPRPAPTPSSSPTPTSSPAATSAGSEPAQPSTLAFTGAAFGVPIALGIVLLAAGLAAIRRASPVRRAGPRW
jgi:hypothetical protein